MTAALALYCSDAVRLLDRQAIEQGTPAEELMERAGAGAFAALRQRWPEARRLLVCCGPGNNGGDGYVVARLAQQDGFTVQLLQLTSTAPKSAAALAMRERWHACAASAVFESGQMLPEADVVVDALFGIGIDRAVRGAAAQLIEAINLHPAQVLALDVPSGLDADRGSAAGAVVQAELTVSFVAAKRGLYTGIGRARAGQVLLDRLGLAPGPASLPADAWLQSSRLASTLLPPRADDAHKGTSGHVLAVGGDVGMGGAVRLCAEAAARCGAGLVSVLTRAEHVIAVLASRPECMVRAWSLSDPLPGEAFERASCIALGPGLGRGEWGRCLYQALRRLNKPMVVDADALHHLAGAPQPWPDAVLTPHPAEAARLLGCTTKEIQTDRFAALRQLVDSFQCAVVLKGNGSLIAAPGTAIDVVPAGNPGLATGGSGDVLTGVIAALRAQGLSAFDAARLGALVHAQAGDDAAGDGQRGLLASDLMAPLRRRVNP